MEMPSTSTPRSRGRAAMARPPIDPPSVEIPSDPECEDCSAPATVGPVCAACAAERNAHLRAATTVVDRAEIAAHGLDCALRRFRIDGDAACLVATVEEAIDWLRRTT